MNVLSLLEWGSLDVAKSEIFGNKIHVETCAREPSTSLDQNICVS